MAQLDFVIVSIVSRWLRSILDFLSAENKTSVRKSSNDYQLRIWAPTCPSQIDCPENSQWSSDKRNGSLKLDFPIVVTMNVEHNGITIIKT